MKKIITEDKSVHDFPTEYRTCTSGLGLVYWKLNLREREKIGTGHPIHVHLNGQSSHLSNLRESFRRWTDSHQNIHPSE